MIGSKKSAHHRSSRTQTIHFDEIESAGKSLLIVGQFGNNINFGETL
jgi:hypothetical protein